MAVTRQYYLMGSLSHMWSVVDQNVLQHTTVFCLESECLFMYSLFFLFQSFKYNCAEVSVMFYSSRNSQHLLQYINWPGVILFEARGCQKGRIMSHNLVAIFI